VALALDACLGGEQAHVREAARLSVHIWTYGTYVPLDLWHLCTFGPMAPMRLWTNGTYAPMDLWHLWHLYTYGT